MLEEDRDERGRPGPGSADEASRTKPRPRDQDDLPRAFRARAKLFARGPGALARDELVALVLGGASGPEPVRNLARRLVQRFRIDAMATMAADAWREEVGVGAAAAARLCAVFELGRRAYGGDGVVDRPLVSRPRDAFRHVRRLGLARKEHLVGLYLDSQNGLLHRETISVGSLNTTRTHPREILFPAVQHLALGFILAHNHPSGSLEPSPEDVEFTRAVGRAGELMGIELYDHLIVGRNRFTSLRERGLL